MKINIMVSIHVQNTFFTFGIERNALHAFLGAATDA